MLILFVLIAFFAGSALGSFLSVLVDRFPRGETVIRGRSKCEHCHRVLSAQDLIPIFSYLMLSGKCRYCRAKIPFRLFAVEAVCGILTASLFAYSYVFNIPIIQPLYLLIVFFCLFGIFLTDYISGIIPDEFVIAIILATLIFLGISERTLLIPNLLSALGAFCLFMAILLATRGRGMGAGDVKLSFALGLFLGFPNIIVGLYTAFLTAAGVSLILILAGKKKLRGDTIAFGPFLVAGSVAVYFLGGRILTLFGF